MRVIAIRTQTTTRSARQVRPTCWKTPQKAEDDPAVWLEALTTGGLREATRGSELSIATSYALWPWVLHLKLEPMVLACGFVDRLISAHPRFCNLKSTLTTFLLVST